VAVDIVKPYEEVALRVAADDAAPVSLDLTFRARTAAHGLRVGTAIYEITGAHHHRCFSEPRREDLPV
jgi:hypothetical protein